MPSVPIYIRNEDYSKWLAVDNKADFIHNALNEGVSPPMSETHIKHLALAQWDLDEEGKGTEARPRTPVIPGVFKASALKEDNGVCKIHGIPLTTQGKCMQKGCKYA